MGRNYPLRGMGSVISSHVGIQSIPNRKRYFIQFKL